MYYSFNEGGLIKYPSFEVQYYSFRHWSIDIRFPFTRKHFTLQRYNYHYPHTILGATFKPIKWWTPYIPTFLRKHEPFVKYYWQKNEIEKIKRDAERFYKFLGGDSK